MMKNTPRIFIVFTISLIIIACSNPQNSSSFKSEEQELYLNQFKLAYFRQLLIKSYNNSDAVREIIAADHSGFTENLLSADDINLIDSLTTIDNQQLVADSAASHQRSEGAQGKRQLGYIMDMLTSQGLDRLAMQRWEANIRSQSIRPGSSNQ